MEAIDQEIAEFESLEAEMIEEIEEQEAEMEENKFSPDAGTHNNCDSTHESIEIELEKEEAEAPVE